MSASRARVVDACAAFERAIEGDDVCDVKRALSSVVDATSTSRVGVVGADEDVHRVVLCVLTVVNPRFGLTFSAREREELISSWFTTRTERSCAWLSVAVRALVEAVTSATRGEASTADAMSRAREREREVVVETSLRYYMDLVARGAMTRLVACEGAEQSDGITSAAARETRGVMLRAFDGIGRRFVVPMYPTRVMYEYAIARQVLEGAELAPDAAAETACRMCRRGASLSVAKATLLALSSRIKPLDDNTRISIVERDIVPDSLRWASIMMNSAKDANAACRWISDVVFVACEDDGSCTHGFRTLDLVLRVLLRDRFWACDVTRHALCETMLLTKGVPRVALPALLRVIILCPIKHGCGDAKRVVALSHENIKAALESWSSADFVRGASVELQRHLTASVRVLLAVIPIDEWNSIRCRPTQMILQGISARLDSPSVRARRHASKIALELSLKVDASKPLRLVDEAEADEGSSDDEADWERDAQKIALNDFFVIEEPNEVVDDEETHTERLPEQVLAPGFEMKIEDVDPNEVVDVWGVRNRRNVDSDTDDSDDESIDESDDELVPYDMDSDDDETLRSNNPRSITEARIASLPKPQTLRQCIGALRQNRSGDASTRKTDIDLADAAEGAVHSVAELVSNQPHELAAVASDLAVAVLHAQPPTPDSDPLDRARRQALAELLSTTPGLVGPPLIAHALSEKCDASHVMDTLSALEVAVLRLSSPTNTGTKSLDGANEKAVHTIGTERRFAPKSMERRSNATNAAATKAHLIGENFAAPLLRAAHLRLERQSAPGYTPDGLDATVMGQILYTLGQCARGAKNAVDGPLVGEAVLDFACAPALANSREPHLRRSALVAGALVATSLADVPLAVAYAENAPLARALERFSARAAQAHRSDVDADARRAAMYAIAACADCTSRARDAMERLAFSTHTATDDADVLDVVAR